MEHTKADIIFKDFWRNNERFADLFNVVVFGGKEVIKPEALHEMDTDVSGVIQLKDYKETLSRTRDVIKKTAYGVEFVVLGIESQQHIHYAMPLRHMVYDAMSYLKEYQEITRKYKKDTGKKSEDEFLSKMKKDDHIDSVLWRKTVGRTVLSERYDCRNAGRNCRYFLRLQNESLGSTGFRPICVQ